MNKKSGMMLALLAAGQSRRFGDQDKLGALLGDRMLGLHAAATGAEMGFVGKLVIGTRDHVCAAGWRDMGYEVLDNDKAAQGQATSVRLAAACAIDAGASSLCIMLADMPFVTRDHIGKLVEAFDQTDGTRTVASARGKQPMPPAIFPTDALAELLQLQGDTGARKLLRDAILVAGSDRLLTDIDTPDDLAEADQYFRQVR
ncbi:nucleotidyltransferase family protein [Sphingopyxis sp. BSNA05]|uniref:nucleotidyltransferase family protein n=1 Tax=Sphingopyxis sp. BSNA05 TaxID=1236614 RepID=UPI001566CB66|nr:nucleotidyltransferase family protein [Sphingopyxis sp. BSNA05]NRD90006.1 nucleotidyltransferase family protein [Sphingopyxis sp. BSNA05]